MGSHQIKMAKLFKENICVKHLLLKFSSYPLIDSEENLVRELQESISLHIYFGFEKLIA